jgi:hypothetical protein
VSSRFKTYRLGLFLQVFLYTSANAQILNDTAMLNLLKQGVDFIYNCQFDKATVVYEKIKSRYPEHPIPYLYHGMMTYWEFFPLIPSSPAINSFTSDLLTCMDLCERKRNAVWEAEYLLTELGARGLLLLYYADNGLSMEVFPLASKTYQAVMRSFDFAGTYADFYFFTGLYRYYREAYPEAHPVYKPLALLFRRGDRKKGLNELKLAANYSIFMKAEASSFLTGILISFENNYPAARQYSRALYEQYPGNNYFLACYVKNLLLTKQYDEAESILKQYRNSLNQYTGMQKNILDGILQEKKYRHLDFAESLYNIAIMKASAIGDFANEYLAYAYYGLSRIAKAKGENRASKTYYKKAMDLAAYKNVNFND